MAQSLKNIIPHIITLLNLLSGCVAVYHVSVEAYNLVLAFVLLGIFFDFFDGMAARKLDVSSEIGVQLDSLADMITSGLVPGFVLFKLLENSLIQSGFTANYFFWIPFLGFIVTAATGYRLAVFNIKGKESSDFIGLAAPANALMIVSWPIMIEYSKFTFIIDLFQHPIILLVFVIVDIFLLNGTFKLFSFKLSDWSIQKNIFRYIFILISILLLLFLPFEALTLIITAYFLFSYFHFKQKKSASH
jgi:CDP-diacylglycerol--serine O-phosphatidyltransferase